MWGSRSWTIAGACPARVWHGQEVLAPSEGIGPHALARAPMAIERGMFTTHFRRAHGGRATGALSFIRLASFLGIRLSSGNGHRGTTRRTVTFLPGVSDR